MKALFTLFSSLILIFVFQLGVVNAGKRNWNNSNKRKEIKMLKNTKIMRMIMKKKWRKISEDKKELEEGGFPQHLRNLHKEEVRSIHFPTHQGRELEKG